MSRPSQILHLNPPDCLIFKGPFSYAVTTTLRLNNPTDQKVGFKLLSNTHKHYGVNPNKGIIKPHEEEVIEVRLKPSQEVIDRSRHCFLVRSLYLEGDVSRDDLDNIMKTAEVKVMNSKLRCVFTNGNSLPHQEVQQIGQEDQELKELQEKTYQPHIQDEIPHWVIQKDEVQMTEEILGTGGWGEVKVGIFRGIKVAVKCLHQVILSEYNLDLFSREMNIASRVRHPNLLLFIAATRVGNPMIVTELMTTSLRKQLEKTPLTHPHILCIGHDIAAALNYLHLWKPEPIIHRDVSSANVLLEQLHGEQWKGKLCDYGSANFLHQIRTIAPGSPAYAAPEALSPNLHSPKMDVYSFGVLCTEMVTRRLPFGVISKQIERIQLPSVKSLVECCTAHDPQSRPTIEQVLHDINAM